MYYEHNIFTPQEHLSTRMARRYLKKQALKMCYGAELSKHESSQRFNFLFIRC